MVNFNQAPAAHRVDPLALRNDANTKPDGVFIYISTYPDEMAARDDSEIVKDLHTTGAVGRYDASERPSPRSSGFCFTSLIGSAIVSAGVGGHLWKGMSRSDVEDFGELI